MFDSFASTPSRKQSAPKAELTRTIAFLTVVVAHGLRLSYASLAVAAKVLGENSSTQIAAQRGAGLVKTLPVTLQPFICRKAGGYAKGTTWATEVPGNLLNRPVILKEDVAGAVEEWLESLKKDA